MVTFYLLSLGHIQGMTFELMDRCFVDERALQVSTCALQLCKHGFYFTKERSCQLRNTKALMLFSDYLENQNGAIATDFVQLAK